MRTWAERNELFPEWKDEYFTREQMTEERELEWVEYCFEAYEADGFAETYHTPFKQYEEFEGKPFTVVKRLNEYDADLCSLPMWIIKFEDGNTLAAWPEEICNTERKKYEIE